MKKVLVFDLDDTLCIAKTPITDEMVAILIRLLERYEICIISGAMFEQFKIQVIDRLTNATSEQLSKLHIMAAQGTRYIKFDPENNEWEAVYSNDLTDDQIKRTFVALEQASRELGYWEENPAGEIIENRDGTQVTLSALGQQADSEEKYAWDPDHKKREAIIKLAQPMIPDLEMRIGGTTSIDVTQPGFNKSFGVSELMKYLDVTMDDILFFGDMTQPGGNDYPVVEMGVETITVRDHIETTNVLRGILATND